MSNDDKELEEFLYKIIHEISKENASIVFKGGLALKDLLSQIHKSNIIERRTIDIDANWTGEKNLDKITKIFSNAVKKVDATCKLEVSRLPNENSSMGFKILDSEKSVLSKIDLDIKNNPFYVVYKFEDIDIKYSSLEKMLADKLSALSGSHVFRRAKDLLDVYLIIKDNDINIEKIKEILKYDSRELENFETLISNKEIMKDSYEKLLGITNKPLFEEVWNKDIKFLIDNKLIKDK